MKKIKKAQRMPKLRQTWLQEYEYETSRKLSPLINVCPATAP
jgi:hypothetical protein